MRGGGWRVELAVAEMAAAAREEVMAVAAMAAVAKLTVWKNGAAAMAGQRRRL